MNDQTSLSSSFFARVKIVLVGTSHPGNIGASARAMKVMGLNRLCLVAPKIAPNRQSRAMAVGAADLLDNAEIVDDLAEALTDCSAVFGTTARERTLEWPVLSPRDAATAVAEESRAGQVALVFGREDAGLSNDEVGLCHKLIRIPTAEAFSSLNLAQAVQVCAYELRMASTDTTIKSSQDPDDPPASGEATVRLFDHWLQVMTDTGYFHPANPRLLPHRVRRMLAKARYSVTETQIFRGFLTAVEKSYANGQDKNGQD